MAFSRKFLLDNGVPEDKVDVILAERNRTLADYVPKSDVQAQIDSAVEKAAKDAKPPEVNVKESPDEPLHLDETVDHIGIKPAIALVALVPVVKTIVLTLRNGIDIIITICLCHRVEYEVGALVLQPNKEAL